MRVIGGVFFLPVHHVLQGSLLILSSPLQPCINCCLSCFCFQIYDMKNFHQDIDTRITFHELQNDGTQIECNVHTKKGKLFYDGKGDLFEPDLLPTIYLVDNRTNCHGLVNEAGDITVKVSQRLAVLVSLIITNLSVHWSNPRPRGGDSRHERCPQVQRARWEVSGHTQAGRDAGGRQSQRAGGGHVYRVHSDNYQQDSYSSHH